MIQLTVPVDRVTVRWRRALSTSSKCTLTGGQDQVEVGRSLRRFKAIGLQCKCCKCVWLTFHMTFMLIGLDISKRGWDGKGRDFRTRDGKVEKRKEEKTSKVKGFKMRREGRKRY